MGGDNISIEALDVDNYGTWSLRMKALLTQKGLWEALEGSGPVAPGDSQKALALIILNVKDHHLNTVASCGSAKDAWNALAGIYKSQLNARRMTLRKELTLLKKKHGEALTVYFARARSIWTDLQASGLTITESEVVFSALSGLPKEYNTAIAIVTTSSQGTLKLDTVMAQLLQVEAQLRSSADDNEESPEVLLARSGSHRKFPAPSGNQKKKGTCLYCHKPGHYEQECRKKKADEKKKHTHAASTTVLSAANSPNSDMNVWTLDSGAELHISPYRSLFSDIQPLQHPITVIFGKKNTGTAQARGSALFSSIVNGIKRDTKLADVLLVPECTMGNLLSVKQATKRGAVVTFESPEKCTIKVNGDTVLEAWNHDDGLYRVKTKPVLSAAAGATKLVENPQLWHQRFGHLGFDNLAKLVKENLVTGMSVPAKEFEAANSKLCEECIKAKHARHPFQPSQSGKASRSMELVHMDVCGPVSPPSRGGARYFATFLDDYSGLSAVKPLSSKADVADTVRNTLAYMETQCGAQTKAVRTDRGGEYLNKQLAAYFNSRGIRHEKTAPYTPQQNGAAERLNRTLFERIRAMLQDAGLPKDLWAEAALTANYIRNRSPTSSRPKTPWELFYGKTPNVAHMRTFGCVAYAHVPSEIRKKLDSKSEKGIFVGYEPYSKAYRILLDTGKMVVSRDVIFDESAALTPTNEWSLDAEPEDQPQPTADPPKDNDNMSTDGDEEQPLPRYVAVEPRELPEQEERWPKRARAPPSEWWVAKRQHVASALSVHKHWTRH